MNRGIYPILSGALAQEHRFQVLSNNIANLKTTGFKRVEPVFQAVLAAKGRLPFAPDLAATAAQPVTNALAGGTDRLFVSPRELRTDFATGRFRETKDRFHMAIQGPGFFEIKTPQGLRYTRNGRFHLDAKRRLVTETGEPVMGNKGELAVKPGEVQVGPDGKIRVDGGEVGQIKVVEFPDSQGPQSLGEGLFSGKNAKPVKSPSIVPGHLEESNVNAFAEMAELIQVMRMYESSQKVMQAFDRLTEVAIQEVGRVA